MSQFVISTDTTADLPHDYVKEHHIPIIPLVYKMGDEIYGDEKELSEKEFYDRMRNGEMPTTMACNNESVDRHFRPILESGKDILHICFSSALSSSYNTVCVTARDLMEDFPDRKIVVVDSLSAALGEGLLVHKALQQQAQGKTLEETAKWTEENKLHICHMFTVNDLHHLHRGGRISKATAVVGTLINVKPVLHVDDNGCLVPLSNVRGRKKSLNQLVENMLTRIDGYDNDIIFIGHGDCPEDAQYVADLVKAKTGITNFLIGYVCPTIGAHTGPGVVTLFFMGNER